MEVQFFQENRKVKFVQEHYDLVVIGGGLTGVCCAITAARAGVKVALLQDRPVLGGNASSEVRLWGLGATSHMGNNNRWAREGGVINEIQMENVYRNREGNPILFDIVLLDKVLGESNITLFLNTVVYEIEKSCDRVISNVWAYNSSNETRYQISGQNFADCSGDGLISYLSGVSYRMGAEDKEEYNEGFAPDKEKYGELMGHSIFFYMKDTGKPISYVTPEFALKDVESCIPKITNKEYFSTSHHGCKYWWLEYGGRLDTIHDTEEIKKELWKVVYGIWGYIKNSGKFPEMENYTLEWVGLIPGKRESRRFKGLYTMIQQDIIEQREHYDAVAFGGWSIDLHPADGVYGAGRACNQWHSKGIYQIPLRSYVTDEIDNLIFGGRIISASHVANGSTRVMCTSAHGGQAMGMLAALCLKSGLKPTDYTKKENIKELQNALIETGQHIPNVEIENSSNLLNRANIEVSSTFTPQTFAHNGKYFPLNYSAALVLPIKGKLPVMKIAIEVNKGVNIEANKSTEFKIELRKSSKNSNFTPDVILESLVKDVIEGKQTIEFDFSSEFLDETYVFITFMSNENISIAQSDQIASGVCMVYNQVNIAVSNYGRQDPPADIGVEAFEFWCPKRRPEAELMALSFAEPIELYSMEKMKNTYYRPFISTNAWAAAIEDKNPQLNIKWDENQTISSLRLFFDADYDHAAETVQFGHYDRVAPQCVRDFKIKLSSGETIVEVKDNYHGVCDFVLENPVETNELIVELSHPSEYMPASLLGLIIK